MYKPNHGYRLLLIFLIAGLTSCGLFKKPAAVSFAITQTDDYCGGAPPPEDMIAEMLTPKPMPDQTVYIYLKNKKWNTALDVKEGKATAQLKPGVYVVRLYSPETMEDFITRYRIADEMKNCYEEWLNKPVAEFEVTKDMSNVSFNVHRQCDPCAPPPP